MNEERIGELKRMNLAFHQFVSTQTIKRNYHRLNFLNVQESWTAYSLNLLLTIRLIKAA